MNATRWLMATAVLTATLGVASVTLAGESHAHADEADAPHTHAEKAEHDGDEHKHDDRHKRDYHHGKLSDEQIDEALAIVERIDPELASNLHARRVDEPEAVRQALRERVPRLHGLLRLKRWDAQLFDLVVDNIRLERRIDEAQIRYSDALAADNAEALASARQDLEQRVTEHLRLRQQIREHKIARLERRLEELRAEVDEQHERLDELVAARVEELVAEVKDGNE